MKKIFKILAVVVIAYGISYFFTMKKAAENMLSCNETYKPMDKYQNGLSESEVLEKFRECIKSDFNFINNLILPDDEIVLEFTNE